MPQNPAVAVVPTATTIPSVQVPPAQSAEPWHSRFAIGAAQLPQEAFFVAELQQQSGVPPAQSSGPSQWSADAPAGHAAGRATQLTDMTGDGCAQQNAPPTSEQTGAPH